MKPENTAASILVLTLIAAGTGCTHTAGPQADSPAAVTQAESPSWQHDMIVFEQRLAEISADARIPTEEELVGDGRSGFGKEWVILTDGAGGVVDLKPEPGTVQHAANEALNGQTVRWAFKLAMDEMTLLGVTSLIPDLGFDTSKSYAELSPDEIPHLGMIRLRESASRDSTVGTLKAGDRVIVEGTIGDASKNSGFLVTNFEGPVAFYHLSNTGHPVFWVGLTEASIVRDEPHDPSP